jgi:hypothetical protein
MDIGYILLMLLGLFMPWKIFSVNILLLEVEELLVMELLELPQVAVVQVDIALLFLESLLEEDQLQNLH